MANYEATKYDFDGSNLQDVQGVDTGLIIPWGEATPPSGFLECDGSAVSRTTYDALFAVIGTTYGVGDGSTTFNLPDLSDKIVQGRGPTYSLAQNAGSSSVPVTGNVTGNLGNTTLPVNLIGPHTHPERRGPGAPRLGGQSGPPRTVLGPGAPNTGNAGGGGGHGHNLSVNFSGGNVNPEQASIVLMYVIKT